jgi:hypothetical protein
MLQRIAGSAVASLRSTIWHWFTAPKRRPRRRQFDAATFAVGTFVETMESRLLLTVQFTFDYTFDTNHFFDTQAKKDLLELAGHMLGDRMNDSLTAIAPGGVNTWTPMIFNPATGQSMNLPSSLSIAANQIRVYVGSRRLSASELGEAAAGGWSSSGTAAWNSTIKGRGQAGALLSTATDTSVWGGEITFDSTAAFSFDKTTTSLTSTKADFLSVALHELEHVLGFNSFNAAFNALSTSAGFTGAASKALNGGVAIPLSPDRSHWVEGTKNGGVETIMDPTLTLGTRKFNGLLDFAALTDIGWQIGAQDDTIATAPQTYTQVPPAPGGNARPSLVRSASIDTATDVDVYRIFATAGSNIGATVVPSAGLNSYVRLFDVAGTPLAFADQGANGIADNLAFVAPRTDYYYVGVSSFGNRAYNPNAAGSGGGGQTGAYTLTLAAVNAPPTLTGTSSLSYVENQAATVINRAITVADADNPTLARGTVTVTNFVTGQDILGFTGVAATMGNIAAVVNNTTGIVTLTSAGSTATLAQWQTALRAVTYKNSSDQPATTTRNVTFSVDDGQPANHLSNVVASTISITAVNDAPLLAVASTLAYTENQVATAINPGITITDADSTTLASGQVAFTNFVSGQDVPGFVSVAATMGNIVGSISNNGVVTLTSAGSTATLAQWQVALRSVTYRNSSDNPTATTRNVTFTVDDGQGANHASNPITSAIRITPVNDAPILTGTSTLAYTENQVATAINPAVVVTDVDSSLASSTITMTNFLSSQDVLGFTGVAATMGNIAATIDNGSGIVRLTSAGSTATLAQWQAALRGVSYRNSSDNPTTTTRSVTFIVDDGQSANHVSNVISSSITITAVNDAPVLSGTATLAYTENQVATAINAAIVVSDFDNTTLARGSVSMTNFVAGQDSLGFTSVAATMGNIAGVVNNTTGVVTLTSAGSTATLAQWRAALISVTYFNSSHNPSTATRFVMYTVDDGQSANHASNTITATITISAVNDAPVLSGIETSSISYRANTAAVAISTGIVATDMDSTTLTGATIQITGNYQNGWDLPGFVNTAKISGVFNAANGTLTLTGTDSVANYQAALRSVTFRTLPNVPNAAARTITFRLTDGIAVGNAVSRSITVFA